MLLNFATANEQNGSLAQLNRASDYGSEGYRFESCRSHKRSATADRFYFAPTMDTPDSVEKGTNI